MSSGGFASRAQAGAAANANEANTGMGGNKMGEAGYSKNSGGVDYGKDLDDLGFGAPGGGGRK